MLKTPLYFYARHLQKKAEYPDIVFRKDPAVEEICDLAYAGKDAHTLLADVYRPADRREALLPTVLVVHGGGLMVGNNKSVSVFCRQLAKRGFLVCSLSYRLLTEADACGEISDVCEGFRFSASLVERFQGDPGRVSVFAESAGAYLSLFATAAQTSETIRETFGCDGSELSVRYLALSSGMLYTRKADMIGFVYPLQIYGLKCFSPSFMKLVNPEHPEIINHLPPVLLVSSDADFLRRYTLRYAEALEKAGKKHKLLYFTDNEELTHSFTVYRPDLAEAKEVTDQLCELFQGRLL